MNYLENLSDEEYEIVVAATAYAITTLEKEEDSLKRKKTVEGLTRTKSKLEDKTTRTSWSFKWLSGKEAKQDEIQTEKAEKAASKKYSSRYTDAGEESDASPTFKKMPTFTKKHPTEKVTTRVQSGKETIVGTKATSTKKPAEFSPGYKNWDEDSNKLDEIERQADAWEKAKMINAKNRYEKMMSVISEWQTEKKERAKRRMERKQGGPEHKRDKAWQHYNNEISRINKIAGNARALAKERMRNDEMKIREKAAKIRSTGRVPGASWTCC
ncbi:eukaryotic translation initiation factor 3 subunit A isoform X2 [Dendrobium catenatum]|uniref:eukaryotic translation initiation factor 3 subunit A isoform X2 n=1 Tax=Dendrobium catenatum TaxID=906689 RepID=UPI00109EF976|nr:eukaryotic translation initiation factor 3 subunit A isoform X2 [Dendrobium catenatum]